jgi:hypothetical protein
MGDLVLQNFGRDEFVCANERGHSVARRYCHTVRDPDAASVAASLKRRQAPQRSASETIVFFCS